MSDYSEFEHKMTRTCESLSAQLATIRAGRANAAVLDQILVDYWGTPTPIQQMASIGTPDSRTLLIQPWDASALKSIEKAILASNVGITPMNDGKTIRLAFPPLTEERRKELAKKVEKMAEECKVAVRNIRRDANDKIKDMKKNGDMTEDEQKASEKLTQDLTDKYIKNLDAVTEAKKKEIMSM